MTSKKQSKPVVPLTLEDQIQEAITRDRRLEDYAIRHLPIPSNLPRVGDEVFFGNLNDVMVVAIVDDGRRVAIQHTEAQNRYTESQNRSDDVHPPKRIVRVVPTFDVQVKSASSSENFSKPNHYLLHYSQRDVSGLMTMITSFGVDMNPEYQRGLVWDEADKVRLIESMFNQVDIGKFVFRKLPFESEAASYEIVDGKQRLNALVDFMSDKFAYQGKTWSQLSRTDRNYIDGYSVSYAQLAEDYTRAQILDLFVRLNTGGKPMDPKHLEKVAKMAEEAASPPSRVPNPKR